MTVSVAVEPSECPLCMGHGWPSLQQAIRASGVAAQPSQTAALPAATRAVRVSAMSRRLKVSTCLGCWTRLQVSTSRRGLCPFRHATPQDFDAANMAGPRPRKRDRLPTRLLDGGGADEMAAPS